MGSETISYLELKQAIGLISQILHFFILTFVLQSIFG